MYLCVDAHVCTHSHTHSVSASVGSMQKSHLTTLWLTSSLLSFPRLLNGKSVSSSKWVIVLPCLSLCVREFGMLMWNLSAAYMSPWQHRDIQWEIRGQRRCHQWFYACHTREGCVEKETSWVCVGFPRGDTVKGLNWICEDKVWNAECSRRLLLRSE